MLEKALLVLTIIIGFYFCYDFGHLLTGEFGLGQLYGVPLAFILFAFSLLTMFANAKLRSVFRIITTGYFLTLLTYALTILIVKELNPTEYSEYLYHYTYGKSFKIFTWILVAGILLTMTAALRMNRK